ncbi:MAG TPA: hypothetical protein VGT78_03085 [Rhizomicrobium sp.]|nr:hypothetical protein [Rhizomicrobium sp.]
MNPPEWKGKSKELILEACRHGEAKLQAQVQIATSADQRATVLAGIYAATATGIIGVIASNEPFHHFGPFLVGALVTMTAFLVGAFLCILATLPVDFWTPGNNPEEWYRDILAGTAIEVAVGEQASHFNSAIHANNKVLVRNARLFFWGALFGIMAPLIGFFAAGITCLLAVV